MDFRTLTRLAALGLALALPATLQAQDATSPPADGAAAAPAQPEFPTGVTDDPSALPDGALYITEEIGDWQMRCVKTPAGFDPCHAYQLLKDASGNPTAELSITGLSGGGEAVAGATLLTPLETLLTQAVSLAIDGGKAKRYPFTWCDPQGCYARIGLTQAEIDQLKKGKAGDVVIVPARAPNQRVEMKISLNGFTKAYDGMLAKNAATEKAAAEAAKTAPAEGTAPAPSGN